MHNDLLDVTWETRRWEGMIEYGGEMRRSRVALPTQRRMLMRQLWFLEQKMRGYQQRRERNRKQDGKDNSSVTGLRERGKS